MTSFTLNQFDQSAQSKLDEFIDYLRRQKIEIEEPKCNFDVEITITAIDQMGTYDEFILCSGDGDFVKLLKYLKAHKKKTVVVAPGRRLSWILAKTSNRIIYLEDLRIQIEEK